MRITHQKQAWFDFFLTKTRWTIMYLKFNPKRPTHYMRVKWHIHSMGIGCGLGRWFKSMVINALFFYFFKKIHFTIWLLYPSAKSHTMIIFWQPQSTLFFFFFFFPKHLHLITYDPFSLMHHTISLISFAMCTNFSWNPLVLYSAFPPILLTKSIYATLFPQQSV